jgi:hypothetical protein
MRYAQLTHAEAFTSFGGYISAKIVISTTSNSTFIVSKSRPLWVLPKACVKKNELHRRWAVIGFISQPSPAGKGRTCYDPGQLIPFSCHFGPAKAVPQHQANFKSVFFLIFQIILLIVANNEKPSRSEKTWTTMPKWPTLNQKKDKKEPVIQTSPMWHGILGSN